MITIEEAAAGIGSVVRRSVDAQIIMTIVMTESMNHQRVVLEVRVMVVMTNEIGKGIVMTIRMGDTQEKDVILLTAEDTIPLGAGAEVGMTTGFREGITPIHVVLTTSRYPLFPIP